MAGVGLRSGLWRKSNAKSVMSLDTTGLRSQASMRHPDGTLRYFFAAQRISPQGVCIDRRSCPYIVPASSNRALLEERPNHRRSRCGKARG